MSATVTNILSRLRVVDASRRAAREGKQLRYVQRKGIQELICDDCKEPIRYGLCGCTKPAA